MTKFPRRRFLQTATFATLAATLPGGLLSRAIAQTPIRRSPGNSTLYRFKLGNFQLISISDGILTAPAAAFAGNATPAQLTEVLRQGFQSDILTPDCNILFVDTGTHKVLIDSGNGALNGPTAGKLLENLAQADIEVSAIDTVIITHAHADHVGGLTNTAGDLVFPNARYYVANPEWRFWTSPTVSLPKVSLDEATKQGFILIAQKQLGAIETQVTKFEFDRQIIPGITSVAAPGHTPGHTAIKITAGNQSLIHVADTVHTHTINLWNPDWQPIFDTDPDLAAQTRQALLAKIARERTLMFAYHFPFPGIGYLRSRPAGGFEWQPVRWQFEAAGGRRSGHLVPESS